MAGVPFKKGRKTGGRQKGTKNKRTEKLEADIAETGLTPKEYMLELMRSPVPPELKAMLEVAEAMAMNQISPDLLLAIRSWHSMRFEAAKAVAPYVHPRLQTTEVTGKDGGPIEITEIKRVVVDPSRK